MVQKILDAINALPDNPRPAGSKKLKGQENRHRLRVGDYRVLYEIHKKEVVILVVRIRHRKDAY